MLLKQKLLLMVLLFCGCATMQSMPPEVRTRTIQANYEATFKAVVQHFIERGFVIKTMDKEMGLIDTDYKGASTATAVLVGDSRVKVNAMLSEISSDETKVLLTMVAEQKKVFGGWQSSTLTKSQAKQFYDDYFVAIAAKVK